MERLLRWLWMSDVLESTPRLKFHVWFFRILFLVQLASTPRWLLIEHDKIIAAMALATLPLWSLIVHVLAAVIRFLGRDR